MGMEFLEGIAEVVENGGGYFACPGTQSGEWFLSKSADELSSRAQRTANSTHQAVSVLQLISATEVSGESSFLVAKKILELGPKGEPRIQWALVGTRDAAELVRDVSQGPTPYFGTVVESTYKPAG